MNKIIETINGPKYCGQSSSTLFIKMVELRKCNRIMIVRYSGDHVFLLFNLYCFAYYNITLFPAPVLALQINGQQWVQQTTTIAIPRRHTYLLISFVFFSLSLLLILHLNFLKIFHSIHALYFRYFIWWPIVMLCIFSSLLLLFFLRSLASSS